MSAYPKKKVVEVTPAKQAESNEPEPLPSSVKPTESDVTSQVLQASVAAEELKKHQVEIAHAVQATVALHREIEAENTAVSEVERDMAIQEEAEEALAVMEEFDKAGGDLIPHENRHYGGYDGYSGYGGYNGWNGGYNGWNGGYNGYNGGYGGWNGGYGGYNGGYGGWNGGYGYNPYRRSGYDYYGGGWGDIVSAKSDKINFESD